MAPIQLLALVVTAFGAYVVGPSVASAAVHTDAIPANGQFVIIGEDGAADTLTIDCVGGNASVPGSTRGATLPCANVRLIDATSLGGNDIINLTGATLAKFPNLELTRIDGGAGADTVTGTVIGDSINQSTSDTEDTIDSGLGDDVIAGGASVNSGQGNDRITGAVNVSAGPGDDLLTRTTGTVDAGSGDDRLDFALVGPVEGGPGFDRYSLDLMGGSTAALTLSITNSGVDYRAELGSARLVDWNSVEVAEIDLPGGNQTIEASAFGGILDADGGPGDDALTGGTADDVLMGGAGADILEGGGGSDYVSGGADGDTLRLRDGVQDLGLCGDGADSVVADAVDGLSGCESSDIPVIPDAPDEVAPFTLDLAGPDQVKKGKRAKFNFASSEAGGTFMCRVDDAAYAACTSPASVETKKLKGKKHTFSVYAVDAAGNADPTPTNKTFSVKKKKKKKRPKK